MPQATPIANRAPLANTAATTIRASPDRVPPVTTAGTRSSMSPITPPSPVGSGQAALRVRQEAKAAASNPPTIHKATRSLRRSNLRWVNRRQPQAATGSSTATQAMP